MPQTQPGPQQPYQIPPEAVLTNEDLERIEKDNPMIPIAATIMRGDDPVEIPLRLFVYATEGGSKLAQKWLAYPLEVTSQVCQFLDVSADYGQKVLSALVAFIQFVTPVKDGGQGRNPNEWGGDYGPPIPAPAQKPAGQAIAGTPAVIGANQGEIPDNMTVEVYDSSKVPDGMSPEVAEQQSKAATAAALKAVQPNREEPAQAPAVDPAAQPTPEAQ